MKTCKNFTLIVPRLFGERGGGKCGRGKGGEGGQVKCKGWVRVVWFQDHCGDETIAILCSSGVGTKYKRAGAGGIFDTRTKYMKGDEGCIFDVQTDNKKRASTQMQNTSMSCFSCDGSGS